MLGKDTQMKTTNASLSCIVEKEQKTVTNVELWDRWIIIDITSNVICIMLNEADGT